jgi:hypothetical protein
VAAKQIHGDECLGGRRSALYPREFDQLPPPQQLSVKSVDGRKS